MAIKFEDDLPEDFPAVTKGAAGHNPSSLSSIVRKGMTNIEENDRDGRIYASQAAVCVRQAVLTSTRKDTEFITPAMHTYFNLGNAIEDIVVTALKREGAMLFPQYKLPDVGLNLGGYIDGIVIVGGKLRVLEIKSCGQLPSQPKLEHRAQAMVYSAICGLPPTVFYFSRSVAGFDGQLMIREFALTPSLEEQTSTVWQVAYARAALDAGLIPEIPASMTGPKDCGYCPWKIHCWDHVELPRPVVTPDQHFELVGKANLITKGLMTPERVRSRRNGVLLHIQKHGTDAAKEVLARDWSGLISE